MKPLRQPSLPTSCVRFLAVHLLLVLSLIGCSSASHRSAAVPKGFPKLTPAEARHLHAYDVSAANMENTLKPGDVVGANDALQATHGSIIVFEAPASWTDGRTAAKLISRVIAVGGDHIVCCDAKGKITINGTPIAETYLYPGSDPSVTPFDVDVPTGRLWVMGDNRMGSADSRAHMADHAGTIPALAVLGVVTRVLEPPTRARVLQSSAQDG